ncbi:MAG TPA: hypothetical protein VEG33_10365, partial [Streptosporangiaceae bacterium]|nr:hypothetical protein [Streptosporangiaceae bacterium]
EGTSLTVSPSTLRGVIPALGRTPALRGYPGGIDAAGPGWLSPTAGGDQPGPGPASAPGPIPRADGGPDFRGGSGTGTAARRGRGPRARGARARGSAASRAPAGAAGRSVWQQSLGAWREAGLEWQRLAGWEPADADRQRTEPIPAVPAMMPVDAGLAAPPSGGPAGHPRGRAGQSFRDPGQSRGRAGQRPGPGRPHPRRGGRTVLVGAVAGVALLAVAVAGIVITGRPAAGRGPAGLVAAYSPGRLADGQFAGPGGAPAQQVLPSLTGVAAAGRTVVAVGSQATLPVARPLVLTSPDGGHTWQSALLPAPAGGAMPLMVAGGHGRWLAVGPDATWTSPDGRSWRPGPGLAPLAAGDRVRALAQTRAGLVAVGANVRQLGDDLVRAPVLWMSANGRTWQRRGAGQLDLPAGKGRVVSLRWVAARGGVLMIAGEVARTVVRHHGKRKVRVLTRSPGVWWSRDNGASWRRADPPVSHGATARLAGLAATGSGIVAIRVGHTSKGIRDAVAYVWARKPGWRFAGLLTARGRAALDVTSVAGSDQGVVAVGSAGRYRVAFVSVRGRSWRQTARLGRSPATAVTGVTVGPGGVVVAAGAGRSRPFLLLAGRHRRQVGQAALARGAAAGLSVNGLGAGPGGQVAVGQADEAPAAWWRGPDGQWARAAVAARPSWRGRGPGLTGVAHGGAGWLAVGGEGGPAGPLAQLGAAGTLDSATGPGSQQPILMTTPDGRTWRPAAGAGPLAQRGSTLAGAAAGRSGYVVAGVRDVRGQPMAALWWSANLTTWVPRGAWSGSARSGVPSALLAVTAGPAGFAAVGAVGTHPAVWLSRDGQGWQARPLALPAGARSAVFQRVAVRGSRIAALGMQARPSGPAPFAAVSVNGGRTWRETPVPAPGGPAGVTALVTAGGGFLATGTLGDGGNQDVIVWWSDDGLRWHAARPPGRGLHGPGAQQITGLSASGDTLTGVGYTATGDRQHPVLWQARIR